MLVHPATAFFPASWFNQNFLFPQIMKKRGLQNIRIFFGEPCSPFFYGPSAFLSFTALNKTVFGRTLSQMQIFLQHRRRATVRSTNYSISKALSPCRELSRPLSSSSLSTLNPPVTTRVTDTTMRVAMALKAMVAIMETNWVQTCPGLP